MREAEVGKTDTEPHQEQANGALAFLWQQKMWWLLPLGVLVLFLVIIYVLIHLSAADSEMYPTTELVRFTHLHLC